MNLYTTTEEIKAFMGISGSAQDSLIAMFNKSATAVINGILGVSDFSLHKVTSESPRIIRASTRHSLVLCDFPVQKVGSIDMDGTEYTQEDPYFIDGFIVELDEYVSTVDRKVTLDYAAGYNARGMAYIDVVDYTGLSTETITVDDSGGTPVVLTEGTEWDAETSNSVTATSIASAMNNVAGVSSFAVGERVYVMDDVVQGVDKDIAASDSTDMTLSSAKLDALDFPEDIRMAVWLYVSDLMSRRKSPKLQSYTIGSKTVQFSNKNGFEEFKNSLAAHKVSRVHVV